MTPVTARTNLNWRNQFSDRNYYYLIVIINIVIIKEESEKYLANRNKRMSKKIIFKTFNTNSFGGAMFVFYYNGEN